MTAVSLIPILQKKTQEHTAKKLPTDNNTIPIGKSHLTNER
jgi:hypothetical protein